MKLVWAEGIVVDILPLWTICWPNEFLHEDDLLFLQCHTRYVSNHQTHHDTSELWNCVQTHSELVLMTWSNKSVHALKQWTCPLDRQSVGCQVLDLFVRGECKCWNHGWWQIKATVIEKIRLFRAMDIAPLLEVAENGHTAPMRSICPSCIDLNTPYCCFWLVL